MKNTNPTQSTDQDAADVPLSDEAKAYVAKVFPCEPPCDSWGVCSNCCERTVFLAGYNIGYRVGAEHERTQAKELIDELSDVGSLYFVNWVSGRISREIAAELNADMKKVVAKHRARVGDVK